MFKKSSPNGKVNSTRSSPNAPHVLPFGSICLYFQITVYLGKRDFVDHLTHVDPIGKSNVFDIFLFLYLCMPC